MTKRLLLGMFVLLSSITNVANAALELVITDGIDSARPIAIVPFKWEGATKLPHDMSAVIASDLQRSGKFSPVPTSKMPQTPYNASEVNFDAWTGMGVDALLTGSISQNPDGSYLINYQLVDVVRGQLTQGQSKALSADGQLVLSHDHVLFNKRATVPGKRMREYAHRISDLIYQELTGERGAFLTRIAYVVVNDKDQKYPYQLRVSDYDGYNERMVLRSKQPLMSPAWSPDGKKMAMVLSKDGNPEIYVMDLATKQETRLTDHYAIDTEPSWYPDSKSLVFTSERGGRPQLYRVDLGTKAVKRLTFEGEQNLGGSISPDGKYLIMVNRTQGHYRIARQDLQQARQ